MSAWTDAEHDLDRLLDRLDRLIEDEAEPALAWEVWWSLPWGVRDRLLRVAPAWWRGLPRRRMDFLLLGAARLIAWRGLPPLAALRSAGGRLRLPPPRRSSVPRAPRAGSAGRTRAIGTGGPPAGRPPAAGGIVAPSTVRSARRLPAMRARPALGTSPVNQVRGRAPVRRGGGRRVRVR